MATREDLARTIGAQLSLISASRNPVGSRQDTVTVDAAMADDALTLRHIRIGLGLTLLYEIAHLFSASWVLPTPVAFYEVILLDIAVTTIAFALTYTFWCRRRWRELVFFQCVAMVISSVGISIFTAQPIQCFIAAVLLQVGAAALVPWGPRWQASLTSVCLWVIAVGSLVDPSAGASILHLWLELLAAAGLAQFVAALTQGYRSEIEGRMQELRTNEAKL